jgi:NADPH2 dehydrogenase
LQSEDPSFELVSASDVKLGSSQWTPRPLRLDEIEEYTRLYAMAASNAVHKAGFDGVEIHGGAHSVWFMTVSRVF